MHGQSFKLLAVLSTEFNCLLLFFRARADNEMDRYGGMPAVYGKVLVRGILISLCPLASTHNVPIFRVLKIKQHRNCIANRGADVTSTPKDWHSGACAIPFDAILSLFLVFLIFAVVLPT